MTIMKKFFGQGKQAAEAKENQLQKQAEADRARWREERLAWNQKVQHAKRHLVGAKDWRDPHGKAEFVQELFGDKVPQYLWYEFDGLTAEETEECWKLFWPNGYPNFGDWEGHRNLRVRNAQVFLPEVRLSTGKVLPLDQIGHCQCWESIDQDGFPTGTVLFSYEGFYENAPAELAVET